MKVELLDNVIQDGKLKVSMHQPDKNGVPQKVVPFTKGAVVEMSEASGRKYIGAGLAKLYVEPDPPPESPPAPDAAPEAPQS